MKRREFIRNIALYSAAAVVGGRSSNVVSANQNTNKKILNAFYIRAHTYTLVPKNVRSDLDWMKKVGTRALTISVIEQDIKSSTRNIQYIVDEAHKRDMVVYMVPTRWAGIFAGGTRVPSVFSVRNPDSWRRRENGEIAFTGSTGVISSIHYPKVADFIIDTVTEAIETWGLDGVIWDEPKIWSKDYSPAARKMKDFDRIESHYQAAVEFMNRLSAGVKGEHPRTTLHYYAGADLNKEVLGYQGQLSHLDYFGCSGLPWPSAVSVGEQKYKRYLPDGLPGFAHYAENMGAKSMAVIKNMYIAPRDHGLAEKHFSKIMAFKPDNLTYYYYPRNLQQPDKNMSLMKTLLTKYYA